MRLLGLARGGLPHSFMGALPIVASHSQLCHDVLQRGLAYCPPCGRVSGAHAVERPAAGRPARRSSPPGTLRNTRLTAVRWSVHHSQPPSTSARSALQQNVSGSGRCCSTLMASLPHWEVAAVAPPLPGSVGRGKHARRTCETGEPHDPLRSLSGVMAAQSISTCMASVARKLLNRHALRSRLPKRAFRKRGLRAYL